MFRDPFEFDEELKKLRSEILRRYLDDGGVTMLQVAMEFGVELEFVEFCVQTYVDSGCDDRMLYGEDTATDIPAEIIGNHRAIAAYVNRNVHQAARTMFDVVPDGLADMFADLYEDVSGLSRGTLLAAKI